jgi:acyl-CoA oxidase
MCTANLKNAITIAVRYSSVRRQFGPGEEEIPVIEYQLQVCDPTMTAKLMVHWTP